MYSRGSPCKMTDKRVPSRTLVRSKIALTTIFGCSTRYTTTLFTFLYSPFFLSYHVLFAPFSSFQTCQNRRFAPFASIWSALSITSIPPITFPHRLEASLVSIKLIALCVVIARCSLLLVPCFSSPASRFFPWTGRDEHAAALLAWTLWTLSNATHLVRLLNFASSWLAHGCCIVVSEEQCKQKITAW